MTSPANVLGSNTFDLLVASPVGVLTLATVILFSLLRTDLSVTNLGSGALLVADGVFVAWIVAEAVGTTDPIRGG